MPSGIIRKGIGGFYYVKADDDLYVCKAKGAFRKSDMTPLPGDRVDITIVDEEKKEGWIDRLHPRHSCLVRPAVANVDQLAAVIAIREPSPDYVLLDKLLITADLKQIRTIVCINKIDLAADEYLKVADIYQKAGYPALPISTKQNIGFDKLEAELKGRITVFAGQSGVGKSTILNRVLNENVMQTGNISEKIKRGKHTTRHAELIELDSGGLVVDTPGFSSFELEEIDHQQLDSILPEFNEHLNSCRFRGCSHVSEPGCAVKAAVDAGNVDRGRYERYVHLYGLLKQNRDYKNKK